MSSDTNLQAAEALRLANHAIIDAEQHLEVKDIDRACSRLHDAKTTIGAAIRKAKRIRMIEATGDPTPLAELIHEADSILATARRLREESRAILVVSRARRAAVEWTKLLES